MDERLKFVGQLLQGEKMAALCREFGISCKTGYKILQRYRHYGRQHPRGRRKDDVTVSYADLVLLAWKPGAIMRFSVNPVDPNWSRDTQTTLNCGAEDSQKSGARYYSGRSSAITLRRR
jgi:hypothetical protein